MSAVPDATSGGDDDLPSLDDMRDTLMFVWSHFFDAMIASWQQTPGADLETVWSGADVRMRHRTLPATENAATSDFVELVIADQAEAFTTRATFVVPRGAVIPREPVAWTSEGDYESFVAWMVPWVSKHVAEGGGWIDLP